MLKGLVFVLNVLYVIMMAYITVTDNDKETRKISFLLVILGMLNILV